MTDAEPASAEITCIVLAMGDLWDVSRAARLIADHDPDLRLARRIGEIGLDAAVAEAELRPPPTVLGDFRTRLLLETWLGRHLRATVHA